VKRLSFSVTLALERSVAAIDPIHYRRDPDGTLVIHQHPRPSRSPPIRPGCGRSTRERGPYRDLIYQAAREQVHPELAYAVAAVESSLTRRRVR
jgi:soluble lytic murein transglycosylase-like protein